MANKLIKPTDPVILPHDRNDPEIDALIDQSRLLAAQNQALADRGEFLEDCIAEMAAVIYA